MKLLLTSAGFTNKTIIDALRSLNTKSFSASKLAFIPTAANVETGGKEWLIDDLVNCKKLGFKELEMVDISAVPADIWKKELQKADILVLGGGNTFHLMYWLEKSKLKNSLKNMLKNKVYVGISAGSMVATKNLKLSHSKSFYSEKIGKLNKNEGLGFVNFLIRPHLNSPFFPKVRLEYLKTALKDTRDPVYVIDDQTAIKVEGKKVEVVSEGKWYLINDRKE